MPFKANALLVVDTDTVLPLAITLQGFQSVFRRDAEIVNNFLHPNSPSCNELLLKVRRLRDSQGRPIRHGFRKSQVFSGIDYEKVAIWISETGALGRTWEALAGILKNKGYY